MTAGTPREPTDGFSSIRRALVLGGVLIPVNVLWVQLSELLLGAGWPDAASLLFNAVFALLVLALCNLGLRRWAPHWALSPAELAVIYMMLCLSTAIGGHDFLQVLVIMLTTATYYGTPANEWRELFTERLSSPILVTDERAAVHFWEGGASLYSLDALRPWLVPAALWIIFAIALLAVMTSINALVWKRWNDEEKLTYPLLEVPLDLTRPGFALTGRRLLGNRLLWVGFSIAGGIDLLNGFAHLYPSLPSVHVTMVNLTPMLRAYPWRAMGWTVVAFYPFAIGLGYMMPNDFLFSSWFFYWFWKLERIGGYLVGRGRVGFPYVNEQAFGAYIAIGVFALWTGRRHLARLVEDVLRGRRGSGGRYIPYGLMVGTLAAGVLVLVTFTSGVLGIAVPAALFFLGGYLLLAFSITRMRAEFGLPVHDFWTGPLRIGVSTAGAKAFGRKNLLAFSSLLWLVRSQRSQPMPHSLEAMALGERRGLRAPPILWAIGVAVVVSTVAGFWSMLHIGYNYGMGLDPSSDALYLAKPCFQLPAGWVRGWPQANWERLSGLVGGFGLSILLLLLRLRFLWWPLHPAGYAASSMRFMGLLWLPMLIAWVTKVVVMRYSGYKLYRRLYPFFMGLILGEFVIGGALWGIAGTIGRFRTYRFWPY